MEQKLMTQDEVYALLRAVDAGEVEPDAAVERLVAAGYAGAEEAVYRTPDTLGENGKPEAGIPLI
jgi:hypothetical protein